MTQDFARTLLILIAIAFAVGLVVAGFVYAGSTRATKRYRPGRPFVFTPVWFLASPERQARAGVVPGQDLIAASTTRRVQRPRETGGASDRW